MILIGRLIDADVLMKNIIDTFHCQPFIEVGNTREYIDRIINNVPTAYDVGKVVEQLKQDIDLNMDCDTGEPCSNWVVDMQNDMIERYVTIVEGGGLIEVD